MSASKDDIKGRQVTLFLGTEGIRYERIRSVPDGMARWEVERAMATGIIRHDDKVLLVHRDADANWMLPEAVVTDGKTADVALRTAIRDELGMEVTKTELFAVIWERWDGRIFLTHAFECEVADGGNDGLGTHGQELRWLGVYDALAGFTASVTGQDKIAAQQGSISRETATASLYADNACEREHVILSEAQRQWRCLARGVPIIRRKR